MKRLIYIFVLEGVIFVSGVVRQHLFIKENAVAKLDLKFKKKPVFRFDDDNEVGTAVRKQEQRSRRNLRKARQEMDDDNFIH